MDNNEAICKRCGAEYSRGRLLLGFTVCMDCGEEEARKKVHTIVPMHKSNLVVIGPNELEMLKGISNKGGQISGGGQNFDSPTEPVGRAITVVKPLQDPPSMLKSVSSGAHPLAGAVVCNMDDYWGPEQFRRKVGTPKRRTYIIEGGGKVARLTRQPWHKRSDPNKK